MKSNQFKMPGDSQTLSQRIAEFIKDKRKALGLTQGEMAELIFNDSRQQGYICKIEKGKREITVNTLDLIIKNLNAEIQIHEF